MKTSIRAEIKAQRNGLDWDKVISMSNNIHNKLLSNPIFKKAKTIMFYVSKENEVFTHSMIRKAMEEKAICVPAISDDSMNAYAIDDFNELIPGSFGVLEPKIKHTPVKPENIDLVIVPMLAFDKFKHRLGYGKGYYDMFLQKTKCSTIGLAYNFQKTRKLPIKDHDVALDIIITETNTY